jgi:acetyl-CoA decarbonylase/synthase, CODH/ACS complex subunit delta
LKRSEKMAENSGVTLKGINEKPSEYQVQGLEGISIEGDIEIEMDMNGGDGQVLARHLGQEFAKLALLLFDFSKSMGYPVEKTQ